MFDSSIFRITESSLIFCRKRNSSFFSSYSCAILLLVRDFMLEKLKKIIRKDAEAVIITIHGFGVRREHEMDDFKEFAQNHLPEVITFNLFDIENEEDNDFHLWVKRAEDVLIQAINSKKKVYLLGFSMGGVIASYLASKYSIEKLILIAPAFIHFNLENYTNIAIKSGKKLINKKEDEIVSPSLPKSFYSGFMDCVKEHKNAIQHVSCPVLILQGDEDEVISTKSSTWAFAQIPHEQKQCLFLHLGKHRLLTDPHVKNIAFLLIEEFIKNRI